MSLQFDEERALVYSEPFDIHAVNSSRAQVYRFVPENSRVLDVGCACGDLGYALVTHKKCEVWGIEGNEGSANVARKLGVYKNIAVVDLNSVSTESFSNYNEKFDAIVFGDVLEHLSDPENILTIFKKYLRPGGYFVVSLPNISHLSIKAQILFDDWEYTDVGLLDRTHIRFFTYKTILALLSKLNLQIDSLSYTVQGDNVLQGGKTFRKLPKCVRFFIYKNPYSFVFQYVMKLSPSSEGGFPERNKAHFRITYATMPRDLRSAVRKSSFILKYYFKILDLKEKFFCSKR